MTVDPETGLSSQRLYLGDAISFFLNAKRAGGRSDKTLLDYRKKLELFQRWIAADEYDVPFSRIDADTLEAYMMHLKETRNMADSSRKSHNAVLTSFFKTVSKRLKVANPAEDLDEMRFHSPAPSRRFLTRREADLLLAAIDLSTPYGIRDHAAFSMMLYAGLRIQEVGQLNVPDLDLTRGAEEVRIQTGKGNRERSVPINEKLRKSVKRYLKHRGMHEGPLFLNKSGQRLTEGTMRRTLYKYVRRSGIRKTDITPHDLRRTFATWFLQENPDKIRELAHLMGHADLSQVMKYALSDWTRAREGVSKL